MNEKSWEFDFVDLDELGSPPPDTGSQPEDDKKVKKGGEKNPGNELPESKKTSIKLKKLEFRKAMKHQKAREILDQLPKPNEAIHIIQNGTFDFFDYLPITLNMMNGCDEGYLTTWTMNYQNVRDLFDLYDAEQIRKLSIITGIYFKTRETAVYSFLTEYVQARQQRYITTKMHAKIMLLANHKRDLYICMEGSANFTANPRIEQAVITRSKELYEFHKEWMEDLYEQKNHQS